MIRRPPRSTLFPTRRSSDLQRRSGKKRQQAGGGNLFHQRRADETPGHEAHLVQQQVQRSEEHTSELQSPCNLVCRLLLEKKKTRLLSGECLCLTQYGHAQIV